MRGTSTEALASEVASGGLGLLERRAYDGSLGNEAPTKRGDVSITAKLHSVQTAKLVSSGRLEAETGLRYPGIQRQRAQLQMDRYSKKRHA